MSRYEEDVRNGSTNKIPSGLIYAVPENLHTSIDQIRIAFDGDAVIFSGESQQVYNEKGIDAFLAHEKSRASQPMEEGPFAKFLRTLSAIQLRLKNKSPIRTAIVTARNSPADERVIRTLMAWNVRVDEVFFLGGVSKDRILEQFKPHIFFDDQDSNCLNASKVVPTARVPSSSDFAKEIKAQNENLRRIKERKEGKIVNLDKVRKRAG